MAPRKEKKKEESPSRTGSVSSFSNQLTSYIRSGKAGIYIQTYEEVRVEAEVVKILAHLDDIGKGGFGLYIWSCTQGIVKWAEDKNMVERYSETEEPLGDNGMLKTFMKLPEKSILLARDFHPFMTGDNPLLTRTIKDALAVGRVSNRVFIVIGCMTKIPPELEKEIAAIEFKLPTKEQLSVVLDGIAKSNGIELDGNRDPILEAASGLTISEAEDAFAISLVECGDIRPDVVAREKSQTVRKNGILEIIETNIGAADVGGLETLINWLTKRRLAFSKKAKDYGLPIPKGVLTVGLPGCGKTLTAKAAASILGVPLVKLDTGKLFGSLVGQSEANLRTAIQTAEAVAPCVLMVDELEKGFAGSKSSGSTDGGTTSRVFGTFLTWMNDKTAPVFVFATANDVTALPPEFLRKGRFDELWFVDLPDERERAAIWRLHIAKRGRNSDKFDLAALSARTDGFTGSEIEAAVNEALFAAFDEDMEVEDRHLMEAVRNTVPLSRTMATQIDGLRQWASGRARRASVATVNQPSAAPRKIA